MRKIAACISAYNEEDTIGAVLEKTIPLVDELIVVDDGSKDDTGLIAEDFGALVIHHSRNLGKGVSLRHCLDTAAEMNIDIVATLDADRRANLAQKLEDTLPRGPDGTINLAARAWAVRGSVN